jgi:hypothetical protein
MRPCVAIFGQTHASRIDDRRPVNLTRELIVRVTDEHEVWRAGWREGLLPFALGASVGM